MKKLAIVLMFVSLSNCAASADDYKPTVLEKTWSIICSTGKAVNAGMDYILVPKNAVKVGILLSPIFAAYCYYYGINPMQSFINEAVRYVSKAHTVYGLQVEAGKADAIAEVLEQDPYTMMHITGTRFLDKTVNVGLPFLIGLVFTKLLK